MKVMRRSLTLRLSVLSIVWIAMALVFTAILLRYLYRDHIASHFDAHVFTHLEELVGALEIGPDRSFTLARQPTDPRFHRLNSGWYWEVRIDGDSLLKSPSLGDHSLNLQGLKLHESHGTRPILGPNEQKLRAQMMETTYPGRLDSALFIATAPEMQISDDVQHYSFHIITSFLVLGFCLSLAVVSQVVVALRPLKAIKTAIGDVQSGKIKRLPDEFPSDVQPLVDELNHLLDHDERLFKRARNQLGDLAHAVKNPLTVIRNEARTLASREGQLILDQSHIISSSIDHYLSMARSYGKNPLGLRTPVKAVIEDLCYVVEHVYREKGIEIELIGLENCWFPGEPQDLEEMTGNLLDNACKWASGKVAVRGLMEGDRLSLVIDDDGPGIADENLAKVLERGSRMDHTKPGHGQGLGIVKDIVDLYGGTLTLSKSPFGGLRAKLDLPMV